MHEIFIIDGARTPFLRIEDKPSVLTALDLALAACKPLLLRQNIQASFVDTVVIGMINMQTQNIARQLAVRVGAKATGFVVQRDGGSGLQAIDSAYQSILTNNANFVLAGGVEAMSNFVPTLDLETTNWLNNWKHLKKCREKIQALRKLEIKKIIKSLLAKHAVVDPTINMTMEQIVEEIGYKYNISRKDADSFVLKSQQKISQGYKDNIFAQEVVELYDYTGNVIAMDNGIRQDNYLEQLTALPAISAENFGNITVANSAPASDGAAFMLLSNGDFIKEHKLNSLAKIVACCWEPVEPKFIGLGLVYAIAKLLKTTNLKFADIDYWEISEVFAHQVLACLSVMRDLKFCQEQFGIQLGEINPEHLNVHGGALAIGCPVGADGARLVLHLAHTLRNKKARYGIVSVCVAGGAGGAMLLENLAGEKS